MWPMQCCHPVCGLTVSWRRRKLAATTMSLGPQGALPSGMSHSLEAICWIPLTPLGLLIGSGSPSFPVVYVCSFAWFSNSANYSFVFDFRWFCICFSSFLFFFRLILFPHVFFFSSLSFFLPCPSLSLPPCFSPLFSSSSWLHLNKHLFLFVYQTVFSYDSWFYCALCFR